MSKYRSYTGVRGFLNTDALARAWFSAFESAITTIGSWTRVAQTGEFDFTSGSRGANTSGVRTAWRMYRLTDNGTGTFPAYYIKVSIGCNSVVSSTFGIQFTFGNGVDGSGGFTSVTATYTASHYVNTAWNSDSTQYNYFVSGDEGNTIWFLMQDTGNVDGNLFFAIGRTTDPVSGAADARGLHLLTIGGGAGYGNANNASQSQTLLGPNCEVVYQADKVLCAAPGRDGTTFASDVETYLYPINEPYSLLNTALCVCAFFVGDIPKLNFTRAVSVPPVNASRNMRFGPLFPNQGNNNIQHYLNANLARWSVSWPYGEGTAV